MKLQRRNLSFEINGLERWNKQIQWRNHVQMSTSLHYCSVFDGKFFDCFSRNLGKNVRKYSGVFLHERSNKGNIQMRKQFFGGAIIRAISLVGSHNSTLSFGQRWSVSDVDHTRLFIRLRINSEAQKLLAFICYFFSSHYFIISVLFSILFIPHRSETKTSTQHQESEF